MPLTDVAIRNAKPRDKPYKVADTLGLFLLVQPSGGKLWRVKYRIDGKEKKLAIGIYPQVGLAEARRRRVAARELVAAGKDPGREKQREKVRSRIQAETTFDAIAAEFCAKRRRGGQKAWAASTATRSEYLLSLLKGSIGKLPITDIEPADVLIAVRKIERKVQLESARRKLQLAGAVFRYAVATARLPSDPTRDLRGALTAPTVTALPGDMSRNIAPAMSSMLPAPSSIFTRIATARWQRRDAAPCARRGRWTIISMICSPFMARGPGGRRDGQSAPPARVDPRRVARVRARGGSARRTPFAGHAIAANDHAGRARSLEPRPDPARLALCRSAPALARAGDRDVPARLVPSR